MDAGGGLDVDTGAWTTKKAGDIFYLDVIRLAEGSNVRSKLEFAFHLYESLPFRDEVSSGTKEESLRVICM